MKAKQATRTLQRCQCLGSFIGPPYAECGASGATLNRREWLIGSGALGKRRAVKQMAAWRPIRSRSGWQTNPISKLHFQIGQAPSMSAIDGWHPTTFLAERAAVLVTVSSWPSWSANGPGLCHRWPGLITLVCGRLAFSETAACASWFVCAGDSLAPHWHAGASAQGADRHGALVGAVVYEKIWAF